MSRRVGDATRATARNCVKHSSPKRERGTRTERTNVFSRLRFRSRCRATRNFKQRERGIAPSQTFRLGCGTKNTCNDGCNSPHWHPASALLTVSRETVNQTTYEAVPPAPRAKTPRAPVSSRVPPAKRPPNPQTAERKTPPRSACDAFRKSVAMCRIVSHSRASGGPAKSGRVAQRQDAAPSASNLCSTLPAEDRRLGSTCFDEIERRNRASKVRRLVPSAVGQSCGRATPRRSATTAHNSRSATHYTRKDLLCPVVFRGARAPRDCNSSVAG